MARASAPALAGIPRVNLMPRLELERRERSALVKRWFGAVIGAVVIVALVCAGTFSLRWTAEHRVAAAQARTDSLLGELASLSEVSQAIATVSALETFRAEAMASDVAWSPILRRLISALPPGVAIGGFDLSTGGAPADDASVAIGLTGTLTVYSLTPMEMAPVIRSFRALPGVQFLDGREVASEPLPGATFEPRLYEYWITVDFDQTTYSGDFVAGEAK